MERQTQTTETPKGSALLVEAVNKPGLIMKAYSAFWPYSIGNQLLALVQCQLRGIQPGPINTFPKWQTLGRVAIQALSLGCEQTTRVTSGPITDAAHGASSPASRCT
jgi:hypothetical protein